MVVTRTWTSRVEKELRAKLKTENINSLEEISFKDKRNKAIADRCCAVSRGDGRMVGYFHSDGDEPCHCLFSGPQSPVLVSLPSPLHPTVFLPMSSERDFSKIPITKGHDLITFKRHSRPSCGAGRPLPVNSLPASHHWFSPTRSRILASSQSSSCTVCSSSPGFAFDLPGSAPPRLPALQSDFLAPRGCLPFQPPTVSLPRSGHLHTLPLILLQPDQMHFI